MRRLVLIAALTLLAVPAAAAAHPLGNFSVNHLTKIKVSSDRVELRYVLDQAEVPTFQERDRSPDEVLAAKRAEVARALRLEVDGREVTLTLAPGGELTTPDGQGGLKTTRVVLLLSAEVDDPHRVELRDGTFPGRVGWKAIVAEPGEGTAVRSSVASGDPTDELRSYPSDLLESPLDQRSATLSVAPGDGTLVAPEAAGGEAVTTRNGAGDGFAAVFADATSGDGVLVLLLLAALGWGALHALSPGHGKAMVAAYLVGTRGTAKHALALGAIVTVTHTIGVFALGVVTLALSHYVLPEDLYPWLTLVSGLMVVTIGAGVLRSRIRHARRHRAHDHHRHHHHDRDGFSWKGLVGMGASAGLIPCPSALVVLLGAISQHEVALGLLLITAFSLGLAATLTALGLVVVCAGRVTSHLRLSGRLVSALPAFSALLIVAVGCVLTARAVPQLV
jgi:nickel/cobalt exporter